MPLASSPGRSPTPIVTITRLEPAAVEETGYRSAPRATGGVRIEVSERTSSDAVVLTTIGPSSLALFGLFAWAARGATSSELAMLACLTVGLGPLTLLFLSATAMNYFRVVVIECAAAGTLRQFVRYARWHRRTPRIELDVADISAVRAEPQPSGVVGVVLQTDKGPLVLLDGLDGDDATKVASALRGLLSSTSAAAS